MTTKAVSKEDRRVIDKELIKEKSFKEIAGFCFHNDAEVEKFIEQCLREKKTRWMLNRLRWFVELADHQKDDSVKVFFLIAMAETNIKLSENRFRNDKYPSEDVKKFFEQFLKSDKNRLRKKFFKEDQFSSKHYFRFSTVVNALLNVRHRLAHGKDHYEFRFHDGQKNLLNLVWGEIGLKNKKRRIMYELALTYDDFRKLMIDNAVRNIKNLC